MSPSFNNGEDDEDDEDDCEHSFILKDDIGYVCRICGVIQKKIETIIEYQYAKVWVFLFELVHCHHLDCVQ